MEAMTMTTTETPATAIKTSFEERAELLARITELLVGMGALLELSQSDTIGRIYKVNGVRVDIDFVEERHNRFDTRPANLTKVAVTFPMYYGQLVGASYPRNKHGQFNVQKLAERLDAITRAQAAADQRREISEKVAARNYAIVKEVRKEKYGTEYTTDYQRGIDFDSSSEGFTVTLKRRVKSREELVKLIADLEKFLDERSAS